MASLVSVSYFHHPPPPLGPLDMSLSHRFRISVPWLTPLLCPVHVPHSLTFHPALFQADSLLIPSSCSECDDTLNFLGSETPPILLLLRLEDTPPILLFWPLTALLSPLVPRPCPNSIHASPPMRAMTSAPSFFLSILLPHTDVVPSDAPSLASLFRLPSSSPSSHVSLSPPPLDARIYTTHAPRSHGNHSLFHAYTAAVIPSYPSPHSNTNLFYSSFEVYVFALLPLTFYTPFTPFTFFTPFIMPYKLRILESYQYNFCSLAPGYQYLRFFI